MNDSATVSASDVLPGPILIVEDDSMMQLRLSRVLAGVGYQDEALTIAGSVADANKVLALQPFALILIDIGLPDGSGIDLITTLHQQDQALPILVITTWSTEEVIVRALQAGATGYLLKDRDDAEIAMSIRSALRGGAPIDPFVARHILQLVSLPSPGGAEPGVATMPEKDGGLSRRETEILIMVSKGLTNREISELLTLSRLTVDCHIRNIYKKLAVHSRTQAVFEARNQGLLP